MIRVVHITDLHIRHHQPGTAKQPERLSREMAGVLERFTGRLNDLDADVLVVSGDLLDVPDEVLDGDPNFDGVDWPAAIEADYRLFRDWLEGCGLPWVVIPGNHDDEAVFDQVFPDYAPIADAGGIRFVCFRDRLDATRQPERTADSMARLETVLASPDHDRPQIHVQHYTMDPPIFAKGWHYQYGGADQMMAMIEASGRVRALLSGHYHPGSLVFGASGVCYSGVPAFCEAPHPYRIIEIPEAGGPRVTDAQLDKP